MPSKLDLTLIVATVVALVGFIERSHSVVIAPPETVEPAKLASTRSCADEEDMRYGLSRLIWLEDGFITGPPVRSATARSPACNR